MTRTGERDELLTDVLNGAIEGAVNYWASVSEYHWQTPPDERFAIIEDIEDGGTVHRLDLDSIERAMTDLADSSKTFALHNDYRRVIAGVMAGFGDAGDMDADYFDAIAQVATLGDVIYG